MTASMGVILISVVVIRRIRWVVGRGVVIRGVVLEMDLAVVEGTGVAIERVALRRRKVVALRMDTLGKTMVAGIRGGRVDAVTSWRITVAGHCHVCERERGVVEDNPFALGRRGIGHSLRELLLLNHPPQGLDRACILLCLLGGMGRKGKERGTCHVETDDQMLNSED